MREATERTPSAGATTFWVPARLKGLPAAFLIAGLSVIALVGVFACGTTPQYGLSIQQTGGLGVGAANTSRNPGATAGAAATSTGAPDAASPAPSANSTFLQRDDAASGQSATASPVCAGNGTSGDRFAFYYAYFQGEKNRIDSVRANLISLVRRAGAIVRSSTQSADQSLRIVTDRHCVPLVRAVELPARDADSLDATVRDFGLSATNRKYVLFADTAYYCGQDTASTGGAGASWARVDLGCWTGAVTAREIVHLLGATS
jgi:hypothetical protein